MMPVQYPVFEAILITFRSDKEQNRVRLIERRGARLHSISDKKVNPDGYHSYGTRGMRYNSLPHVSRRTGLRILSLRLD